MFGDGIMKKNPFLEAIFQTPDLFVGILDEEGRLIDANQEALNFIDQKLEDVQGDKFWKTPWWRHSEKLQQKLKEGINQAYREEKVRFEADHFPPEGKRVIVDFILRSIESEKNPTRLLALGRDITERKQAERKHRIVTEASSQAIYLFQDGEFKFVNQAFENLSGYTRKELDDIGFLKLVHPDHEEGIAKWTKQALTGDDSGLQERVEYKVLTKEGETIWVRSLPSLIEFEGRPAIVSNAVDITKEKEMEKELRSEKDLLDSIMTLTPDLVYFKDDQHRFERVNEGYTDLLDLDEEEMIGKTAEDFWPEAEEIMEDERRALSGEPVIGRERKVTLPSGEKRWYSIYKFPRRDGEGNIIGFLGMDRDITERKRVQEELKLTEFSLDNASLAVFWITPEGTFTYVNEATTHHLGYSEEELLEMNVADIDSNYPEDRREEHWKELKDKGIIRFETVHERKDGTRVPVEITSHYLEFKEREYEFTFAQDISERKEAERKLRKSEERLELALEGTEAGIWDWNVQTGDVVFSEKWAEIVGYTLDELHPVTIKTWEELAHPEDLKRSEELLEKHFNGETEVYECEARMKHKNEDWVWILDRGKVVEWNERREPVRMVGTHQDITDRKKAEQALDEERYKLRNLHDAVDELQRQDTEEEILQTAVEVAENMLDLRFCDISLVEGDYLAPKVSATGLDSEKSVPFEMGEGITGKTMQKGETIWGNDVREHPDAKPTSGDFRAFISVPIGELGIFQVISEEVGSFTERDVELTEILVGHLREELNRVRLEEDLRQQAIRDPLTDLYNRRYFNETLKKEAQKAERYDNSLAFLMIDVNRFKEINDRFSHQAGDEVLKEMAKLLEDNVRSADTVVRYGGDEFLIMMPETNGGVTKTIDRLNEELDRWNQQFDLLDFSLTLAMGVSHWSPDQERDVEEALNEADRKMYEDKRENG